MSKKTVVMGASPNPGRYSYLATNMLREYGHETIPLGIRKGSIQEAEIITDWPEVVEDIDTVTMYVGPARQKEVFDYVLSLKPKRIIFNPGTESEASMHKAREAGIEVEEACTLVMLRANLF